MAKRIFMVLASILCLMQMHAETYISDIKIGSGSKTDRSVSYNNAADGGYTVIDYDLNKKVGGDYIYLSYKTTTDPTKAISDIIIMSGEKLGDDRYLTTPRTVKGCNYYLAPHKGDSRDYGDLNRNAGGDYLYMFYTREGCRKVTGMTVNTTESGSASEMDLNSGTSTIYHIYLHLTKSDNHTYADEAKTLCTTCNHAWCYYTTSDGKEMTLGWPFIITHSSKTEGERVVMEFSKWPEKLNTNGFKKQATLTSITLPASIKSIGDYAFRSCTALKSITIPDSVKTIGYGAFYGCTSLTDVTISKSVTKMECATFLGCTALKSITIPNSVTKMDQSVFEDCTSLTTVNLLGPITSIETFCFKDCYSLTSITIPETVTSIKSRAFKGCRNLQSIVCKSETPPAIDSDIMNGLPLDYVIYVPTNSVEAYKNADGWKEYKDHIRGMEEKEWYDGNKDSELAQGALFGRLQSINQRLDNINAGIRRSPSFKAPSAVEEPANPRLKTSLAAGTLTYNTLKAYSIYDVDHNSKLNISDITKIADYAVGKISDTRQQTANTAAFATALDAMSEKVSRMAVRTIIEGEHNGHQFVDLGLPSGTLWADRNVGANYNTVSADLVQQASPFYKWGETEPKNSFDDPYSFMPDNNNKYTKYVINSEFGTPDGKEYLEPEDDVARVKWGGHWRIPSDVEFQELLDYCVWVKKNLSNQQVAYEVTSKINGKKIYLAYHYNIGYWANRLKANMDQNAYCLDTEWVEVTTDIRKYLKMVRPVVSYEDLIEK